MAVHGIRVELMVALVRADLAIAKAERVFAGGHKIEIARVKITEAGRRRSGRRGGAMEKLLENASWPLALLAIAIVFFLVSDLRSLISDLVNRMRGVSYGNRSVDMTGAQATVAVEKQKEADAPAATRDTRPASHMMPPLSELYSPIEQQIRASLKENPRPWRGAWEFWMISGRSDGPAILPNP
jgi:hypothetical protein